MPAIRSSRRGSTTRTAPTSSASSTSRPRSDDRDIMLDVVARTARQCLHAADRRRRRAHRSTTSASCCSPAPTRSRSTPRRCDRPEFVREAAAKFGAQCIVVAIDAKADAPGSWEVFTHGGRTADRARRGRLGAGGWCERGAGEILLTSMDRDGTQKGFDLALTRAVADAVPVPVIASGGVGTLDHLVEGVRDGHASAVLAASIFHFGHYTHRRGQGASGGAGHPSVRLWRMTRPDRRLRCSNGSDARSARGARARRQSYTASCSRAARQDRAQAGRGGLEAVLATQARRQEGASSCRKRRRALSSAGALGPCRDRARPRCGRSWRAARAFPASRKRTRAAIKG